MTEAMVQRAMVRRLETDLAAARRTNARLRAALLHSCPICRLAWCEERERLIRAALGRQWQLLEVPGERT